MSVDARTVRELFERAIDLPEREREAFVAAHGDDEVRRELASLLECHARADRFLGEPVAQLAGMAPPSAVEFAAGDRIDAYVVRRRLGEGGMGAVYLAEQLAPVRREVALKVLKFGAGDRERLARFALESQALALMDHENVARIHGAGSTADGRPYFAMEYVAGAPLARFCDERRMSIEQRLRLFVQICAGVEHAHARGVLHRDLKPSNVLVCDAGGVPVPKIIDFGIAKALVGGLADDELRTAPGTVIGTLDYMSPEQALSDVADRRSDVYSLGVLLYELLAGSLPYEFRARRDLTLAALQRAFELEDPLPPSLRIARTGREAALEVARARNAAPEALRARVAGDLDWIVLVAIAKERARRYASAAQLGEDVERHLRHEPVRASPPSAAYRARKFVRRNKLWVGVVATLLIGLIATLCAAIAAVRARGDADRNLALVVEQRNHLLPLADFARWQSLRQEAERLWPAEPRLVAAMDDWLARANELVTRRAQHEALLANYDASGGVRLAVLDDDRSQSELAGAEADAYFALINRLVRGLERFDDPHAPPGSLREMQARRDFAASLERKSLIEPAAAWHAAIEQVAASPLYDGLRVEPQLGLVPLAADPQTQLFEFAHLPSGAVPLRTASGGFACDDATALVLVLIPSSPDVPPFYFARHALTRGQWNRMRGAPEGDDEDPLATLERADSAAVALALEHAALAPPTPEQRARAAQFLGDVSGTRPARALVR